MSSKKKPALFVDRDGVINKMVKYEGVFDSPLVIDDVKLLPGIVDIIKWANKNGFPVIEISNQPGVAKGKMSKVSQQSIEKRVHVLLKKKGAKINKIYICPHHPKGVVKKFAIVCDCRKPKPGLILRAASDLNIDLEKSIFMGDSSTDVEAGKAAGVKTIIHLHSNNEVEKVRLAKKSAADHKVTNIIQALPILKKFFEVT